MPCVRQVSSVFPRLFRGHDAASRPAISGAPTRASDFGARLDGPLKSLRRSKQLAELIPRALPQRALLPAERALQIDRLPQQRLQILLAARRPRGALQRLLLRRCFEVDQDRLERRRTDDDVVQLGVAMREAALL